MVKQPRSRGSSLTDRKSSMPCEAKGGAPLEDIAVENLAVNVQQMLKTALASDGRVARETTATAQGDENSITVKVDEFSEPVFLNILQAIERGRTQPKSKEKTPKRTYTKRISKTGDAETPKSILRTPHAEKPGKSDVKLEDGKLFTPGPRVTFAMDESGDVRAQKGAQYLSYAVATPGSGKTAKSRVFKSERKLSGQSQPEVLDVVTKTKDGKQVCSVVVKSIATLLTLKICWRFHCRFS